ncbi:YkgJ family cysteine cluster protein [Gracilibacillus salitolerans]|uniref:YkgJ family cysteine cluster protein n=1 Tax=Gracilibacillus salitolerans TaxID=2663022 RepID=A0A5Q2TKP3_9BACI|nr:YkgJ family cysteine cluster protein [Gracilibacillus salitolerans]QGH34701.1 YkgJ family cysteine cluster protein [Gracilibacillus salitolerans]
MNHYLTHKEIIEKCNELNEKYQINEDVFYQIVDQLIDSNLSPDQKLVHSFQLLLEAVSTEIEQMEKAVELEPTCRMGCAFCCYFPIVINKMEAKLIENSIRQMPKERKERLEKHFANYYREYKGKVDQFSNLDVADQNKKYNYKKSLLPCVMLDTETNQCLAYEIRPLPCRTYVNYSDPTVCADNVMPEETISYEFLYQEYMGAINELLMYLYEQEDTGKIEYPNDLYQEDLLINWMKDFS